MYNFLKIQQIKEILLPAIGEKVWGASLIDGSHISFELGDAQAAEWDPSTVHGKWYLFTNMCEWRLEKNGDVLVGSEDHPSRVVPALKQLDEKILLDFDLQLPALDTIFVFSDQMILRIFRISFIINSSHWIFRSSEDGQELEIGPGASCSIQNYKDKYYHAR
jgi:hypothetical protein